MVIDFEISDNGFIGKFAGRSLRRSSSAASSLLRYNIHISYVTDANKVFKCFCCSAFEKFPDDVPIYNNIWLLPKCEELVINIYPRSFCQIRETVFNKLKAFDSEVTEDKLLLTNFAVFDFESICVRSIAIAGTEIDTWAKKQEPILVSITSVLLAEPLSICDTELQSVVSNFVTSLTKLAEKSNMEMGLKFPNIGTTIKGKLERGTLTINKRRRTF